MKYNKTLDFAALAIAHAANGEMAKAGALLIKAARSPDVEHGLAVLEASNALAFKTAQEKAAEVVASKKAAKTAKLEAAKRVAAATQVKAFDVGDDATIDGLLGDDAAPADDDEPEVDAAAEEDEDEGDEPFDATFAAVLAGMEVEAAKPAAKPKAKR